MKSLSESLFDPNLAKKTAEQMPYEQLADFLNDNSNPHDDAYERYTAFIQFLMQDNPKLPNSHYNYSSWGDDRDTKPLMEISDIFKKEFIRHQTKNPMSMICVESEVTQRMTDDDEPGPIDDFASNVLYGMHKSSDNICRVKSLNSSWINCINDYTEYLNWPKFNTKCDDYLCICDDVNIYIVGFPKGIPSSIRKVFRME